MSVYLDASFLVPLLTTDKFSERARKLLISTPVTLFVSDWTTGEFCSALAKQVRRQELDPAVAQSAFDLLDVWVERMATRISVEGPDHRVAEQLIRSLRHNLRTPDALHIAIARRLGASLATFDDAMTDAALAIGVPLAPV